MRPVATQGAKPSSQLIDLGLGHPSADMLPLALVRDAARARLEAADPSLLQYGLEQGDPGFRERIAALTGGSADQLFVTAGASQALDLLCTLYTRPGDTVITAEPTYHLALRVFADHGLDVRGVKSDEHGPEVKAIERIALARNPKLLYLVTPFANPSGTTVSAQRLEEIAELAQANDFWLVTDEVYRLLAFDDHAPPRLGTPKAISLNSFSKILSPGLRLGWIAAPEQVLKRIEDSGLLMSGGGLNPFIGAITDELLEGDDFDGHLSELRKTLATRANALTGSIKEHLPEARFVKPEGGYFIWLRLPGVDTSALLPAANEAGVNYQPGARFSSSSNFRDRMRLSFAHYPPDQLHTAVQRLARAVESVSPDKSPSTSTVGKRT